MPGMSGYEFVRKVKERNPKVKVILTSSFGIENKEFAMYCQISRRVPSFKSHFP
jgi:YesN/AraC family two-component response regulator